MPSSKDYFKSVTPLVETGKKINKRGVGNKKRRRPRPWDNALKNNTVDLESEQSKPFSDEKNITDDLHSEDPKKIKPGYNRVTNNEINPVNEATKNQVKNETINPVKKTASNPKISHNYNNLSDSNLVTNSEDNPVKNLNINQVINNQINPVKKNHTRSSAVNDASQTRNNPVIAPHKPGLNASKNPVNNLVKNLNLTGLRGHSFKLYSLLVKKAFELGEFTIKTTLSELHFETNIKKESLRSTIKNLCAKELIQSIPLSKGGPKALKSFKINPEEANYFISKQINNYSEDHNPVTNPVNKPGYDRVISSYNEKLSYNNKLYPDSWNFLYIPKNLETWFNEGIKLQLGEAKLKNPSIDFELIQESLYAISADLSAGVTPSKGSLFGSAFGTMKKGRKWHSEVLLKQFNAEIEKQESLEREMEELEKRRNELKVEEQNLKRNKAYTIWRKGITSDQAEVFVPTTNFMKIGSPGHEALLKGYFEENIYQKKNVT